MIGNVCNVHGMDSELTDTQEYDKVGNMLAKMLSCHSAS